MTQWPVEKTSFERRGFLRLLGGLAAAITPGLVWMADLAAQATGRPGRAPAPKTGSPRTGRAPTPAVTAADVRQAMANARHDGVRTIRLTPAAIGQQVRANSALDFYRNLITRQGSWAGLTTDYAQSIRVNNQIRVVDVALPVPAGAIILGFGDWRSLATDQDQTAGIDLKGHACSTNVVEDTSGTTSCSSNACGWQYCGLDSCSGNACGKQGGTLPKFTDENLVADVQSYWTTPLVTELAAQFQVNTAQNVATAVTAFVARNGYVVRR
jgi:hypothetical protein